MSETQELKSIAGMTTAQFTDLILQDAINMGAVSDVAPGTSLAAAKATKPVENSFKSTDATELVKNVFFVSVRRGSIGNSRQVKDDILTTDADKSRLRVTKKLLESPELDAIRSHDNQLRKWLKNTCLPFDIGILLLPQGFVNEAKTKFKEHKIEREALVDKFVAAYPERIAEAEKQLGSQHNASEYLPISEVKKEFTFEVNIFDFRTPEVIKQIDPEWYAELVKNEEQNLANATQEITGMMREVMFDLVSKLQDRLTPGMDGKNKILKEAAIDNLREFLNNFDLRNITGDKQLALEVEKAKALLVGTNAAMLKNNEEWKEKIRAGMEHITKNLGEMVVDKTGRKFRAE